MSAKQPVVVVAPDSFKGSLAAQAIAEAIGIGVARVWRHARLLARPMADGGEGTLDAVLHAVGSVGRRTMWAVHGAGGHPIEVPVGVIEREGTRTAVIEVAAIVGLTDAAGASVDVEKRSTRGVGELLGMLLDAGIDRFMIGLGGSSTNDAGAGLLAALGLGLRAEDGRSIEATPHGLAALASVDVSRLDPRLGFASITIMSDVSNPLAGAHGATAVFGPQKGVRADRIAPLDATLSRFARAIEAELGRAFAALPGAGAAGGLGFALQLVGGTFASGAEVVADLIGLDDALAQADWAITGEGRSDTQTLSGKAPFVVSQRARRAGVPVSLLSGAVDTAALPSLGAHFAGCFALPAGPTTLDASIAGAASLLADRAEQMTRLFDAARTRDVARATS